MWKWTHSFNPIFSLVFKYCLTKIGFHKLFSMEVTNCSSNAKARNSSPHPWWRMPISRDYSNSKLQNLETKLNQRWWSAYNLAPGNHAWLWIYSVLLLDKIQLFNCEMPLKNNYYLQQRINKFSRVTSCCPLRKEQIQLISISKLLNQFVIIFMH